MAAVNLDDLTAAVAQQSTVIDSAIALIHGLADQIAALPATQEAIDALAVEVRAKANALADSVTQNTPSA